MTVTTLNLFNYLSPPNAFYSQENIYTEAQWLQKQNWLDDHLSKQDSDIVAFQEVFSIESLHSQVAKLGYPHFATVDTPFIEHNFLYSQPVLALASKHPIVDVHPMKINSALLPYDAFEFSRSPIHAVVDMPNLGLVDIYVVHFKSKRLELENERELLEVNRWSSNTLGLWYSTVQRGFEAHLLFTYVVQNKHKHSRPFMLMGDFNNAIEGDEFACFKPSGTSQNHELASYGFHDAWHLVQHHTPRPPTHYYGSHSQVLDYILLSDEFSPSSANRLATVNGYSVNDKHLIDPRSDQDLYSSDHASVSINISFD
nr:endonuclease/exonuclease/phosphatase family protein [Vibrio sinus]